jgi:hypothetical protein
VSAGRPAADGDAAVGVDGGDHAVGEVLVGPEPVDAGVTGPRDAGGEDSDELSVAFRLGDGEVDDGAAGAGQLEGDRALLTIGQLAARDARVEYARVGANERDERP